MHIALQWFIFFSV